jgi:pimeloyl-ACP methyl ester carboxylesterase
MEAQWRRNGVFPIEEGASGALVNLHVSFLDELKGVSINAAPPGVPTLIIHGTRDESISVRQSEEFSSQNPNVTLTRVDDDHQLLADPSWLLRQITEFLRIR